jgi:hypothetical protein
MLSSQENKDIQTSLRSKKGVVYSLSNCDQTTLAGFLLSAFCLPACLRTDGAPSFGIDPAVVPERPKNSSVSFPIETARKIRGNFHVEVARKQQSWVDSKFGYWSLPAVAETSAA